MDDAEYLCPLCCEELDISDREFYPCKCGYQVCMWCWHRIRESESGLCPACRTPYGEDPHQFSAVDVEEVLRANKEKEAAAKRERQQRLHNQNANNNSINPNHNNSLNNAHHNSTSNSTHNYSSISNNNASAGTDGGPSLSLSATSHHDPATTPTAASAEPSSLLSPMEVPKDRTQLANMRVIRRNLVYAVGLPPNIAYEDILRKPEYFGQYGKISKIVLNRTQVGGSGNGTNPNGDSRRASASAYVTFHHKEDTLACILALDGFYLEGRNIRASYGTSKYCSAFIKNVRCSNPECTYLHEMGVADDTFTKQEIQAGYVTSGRDVLARQQQIVAEQILRHGPQAGAQPRKRVGGGGPSGTGKASANPVFPPPEYDDTAKSSSLVPPPAGITRSSSAAASLNPANIAAKLGRTNSVGTKSPTLVPVAGQAPPTRKIPAAAPTASSMAATVSSTSATTTSSSTTLPTLNSALNPTSSTPAVSTPASATAATTTTAASVVAGNARTVSSKMDPGGSGDSNATTTLTPLTHLKRSNAKTATSTSAKTAPTGGNTLNAASNNNDKNSNHNEDRLASLRNGQKQNGQDVEGSSSPTPDAIGGEVIGPPLQSRTNLMGPLLDGNELPYAILRSLGGEPIGLAESGNGIKSLNPATISPSAAPIPQEHAPPSSALLGGEVYTGQLQVNGSKSAIGRKSKPIGPAGISNSLWDVGSVGGKNNDITQTQSVIGGNSSNDSNGNNKGIAGINNAGVIGGQVVGNNNGAPGNSTSALASILGINLPTGSGSLQESTNLWSVAPGRSPQHAQHHQQLHFPPQQQHHQQQQQAHHHSNLLQSQNKHHSTAASPLAAPNGSIVQAQSQDVVIVGGGRSGSSHPAHRYGMQQHQQRNHQQQQQSPVYDLIPQSQHSLIGNAGSGNIGGSLIGGTPIGGSGLLNGIGTIGGGNNNNGNENSSSNGGKSDIALLQSLLPGVHITSGNEALGGGFGGSSSSNANNTMNRILPGWNAAPGARSMGPGALGGDTIGGWGLPTQGQPGAVGAIGPVGGGSHFHHHSQQQHHHHHHHRAIQQQQQQHQQHAQQQRQGPSIW